MKSILKLTCLALLTVLLSAASGCGPTPPTEVASTHVVVTSTNKFYEKGWLEGQEHAKQRPTTSLMVFPAESTNWSPASVEVYRSGYVAGLGSK